MKRVAVLGGTGMAGHVVATYLDETGYDVYRASRSSNETKKSRRIDAADFNSLGNWLDEVKPDIVVNCIGALQKLSDERPDQAILLNAYLPQWIAYKYKSNATKLIHLSTDCVFSGARGGYTEADTPDGVTNYDRSKALGEVNNNKDLTFRMSIIGPDQHENGTGLFNWFMKQSGTINGFTKALWNGVTTIELARAIDEAIRQDIKGLYQLAPLEIIDKYSLLQLFKETFKRDNVNIIPFDGFVADKTLVNTRKDFEFAIRSYPRQIEDMRKWILSHSEMYGDYYFS